MSELSSTMFAPARRASSEAIRSEHESVSNADNVLAILEAQPGIAGIINRERQFVMANPQLLHALGMEDIHEVLGRRPGEALDCVHSVEEEGGCGTAASCRFCGAVHAILQAQESGRQVTKECLLACDGEAGDIARDLRVTATPCTLEGLDYILLSIADVGAEKRREALEHAFFHDMINTATVLWLTIDQVEEETYELPDDWPVIKSLSGSILDDVIAQRDIASAERGELKPKIEAVEAVELLREAAAQLGSKAMAADKSIEIDDGSENVVLRTDRHLFRRILFNMLKNALEDIPRGSDVSAGVRIEGDTVAFTVHNDTVMPPEAQANVFHRSFSTKGPGRGLGTYSMKLLGERYLGGTIEFTSSEQGGTTFVARFPRDPGG